MSLSYHTFNTHKVLPQLTKLNNRLSTLKHGNQVDELLTFHLNLIILSFINFRPIRLCHLLVF